MIKNTGKIDSKTILKEIKNKAEFLSCIDISDEFEYEDMFIYDCMIPPNVVAVTEYDGFEMKLKTLDEVNLREHEVEKIVGELVYKIEEEILIKYDIDNIRVDYKIYTFFDYISSIKFVIIVDLSEKSVHDFFKIKDIVVDTQLTGKSKYLF